MKLINPVNIIAQINLVTVTLAGVKFNLTIILLLIIFDCLRYKLKDEGNKIRYQVQCNQGKKIFEFNSNMDQTKGYLTPIDQYQLTFEENYDFCDKSKSDSQNEQAWGKQF